MSKNNSQLQICIILFNSLLLSRLRYVIYKKLFITIFISLGRHLKFLISTCYQKAKRKVTTSYYQFVFSLETSIFHHGKC